jgi:hypothetical protein
MPDQLEAELTRVLAQHAAAVPADSASRLCDIDFAPRPTRWSPKVTVASLAGAAAATGTVVSVIVLGGAQPAFAGWTAAPTPAPPAQSTSATANCQAQLTQQPAATGDTWTPVATDVRGPYTVASYQDGSSDATCFTGPSFTTVSMHSSSDGGAQQNQSGSMSSSGSGTARSSISNATVVLTPATGGVTGMTVEHLDLESANGASYTLVEGQVTSAVSGVTLDLSDGSHVVATVGGGTLIAWWPGNQGVSSVEATTPSGQTSQSVTTEMLPLPPALPSSCAPGVTGQSGAGPTVQSGSSGGPATTCSGGTAGLEPAAP